MFTMDVILSRRNRIVLIKELGLNLVKNNKIIQGKGITQKWDGILTHRMENKKSL